MQIFTTKMQCFCKRISPKLGWIIDFILLCMTQLFCIRHYSFTHLCKIFQNWCKIFCRNSYLFCVSFQYNLYCNWMQTFCIWQSNFIYWYNTFQNKCKLFASVFNFFVSNCLQLFTWSKNKTKCQKTKLLSFSLQKTLIPSFKEWNIGKYVLQTDCEPTETWPVG